MAVWIRRDNQVISDIRIGFGGMAATPARAYQLEHVLKGHDVEQPLPDAAGRALAKDFQPISDMRASSAYRLLVAENLLRKMLIEVSQDNGVKRLYPSSLPPAPDVPKAITMTMIEAGE